MNNFIYFNDCKVQYIVASNFQIRNFGVCHKLYFWLFTFVQHIIDIENGFEAGISIKHRFHFLTKFFLIHCIQRIASGCDYMNAFTQFDTGCAK